VTNLTNRSKLKRFIGLSESVTQYDSLLDALISAGTARIEHLTGRNFGASDYRQWHSVSADMLVLRHRPVIRVTRIATGKANALQLKYGGGDIRAQVAVYADANQNTTGVRLHTLDASGTATNSERTFTDYPTLSTLASELNSIADWTVTQAGDDAPAADLHPTTGLNALNNTVNLTRPDQDTCTWQVDYLTGMIDLDNLENSTISMQSRATDRPQRVFGNVLVEYRAGFDTIPADIEQLAHEFIKTMFDQASQNMNLKSESLGDYSYTLAKAIELTGRQLSMLQPYTEIR